MKKLFTALFFLIFASTSHAKELTVYTYSSFTADWGPGPAVKQSFEAQCQCTLNFVALDDGVALLSRLKLEGKNSNADIVLGLDTNLLAEAKATGLFAEHGINANIDLPGGWSNRYFLPYDYGYFAFVYNKEAFTTPPDSLAALVDGPAEQKIIIQDPRSSTPGLGLLLWIQHVYGDQASEIWQKLDKRILTVTKGWSEAYGLFLEGEAPLVFSYTTSPAYHLIAEKNPNYAAAAFDEGHYMQVEVAGMLRSSKQPQLAREFLQFMIGEGFQQHVATGNWMYPVNTPSEGLPAGFETLVQPSKVLRFSANEVAAQRKEWVKEWLNVMSR